VDKKNKMQRRCCQTRKAIW